MSSCGNHRWCCQNSSYNSTWCCRGSETSLLPEVTQDAIRVLLSPTAIPRRPDFKSRNILLGVGIGLGLPLALSLTACIWFFLRKRRRRELPPPAIVDGHKDDNARIFELSGHREFELNTGPRSLAVEMSGRTPSWKKLRVCSGRRSTKNSAVDAEYGLDSCFTYLYRRRFLEEQHMYIKCGELFPAGQKKRARKKPADP